jgi:hypothetical protein
MGAGDWQDAGQGWWGRGWWGRGWWGRGWWGRGWWGRDVVTVFTAPAQFTCWHNGQAKRVRHVDETDPSFLPCLDIARDVLAGKYRDLTGGADHYHTASMDPPPPWARGKEPCARIGAHLFYKLGLDGRG